MMAELRRLFAALKTEIALPGNTRLWATAQQRHPILNRVATIHTVLAILGDPGNKALRYKDILTRAVIAEHKRNPGAFWTAALLLAYSPMLNRLRGRIMGDAFSSDDLDQLVISAFLDVVKRFPLLQKRSRTFLHLRRMTEQRVFKKIRTRQKEIHDQQQLARLARRLDELDLSGEIKSEDSDVDREEMAELLLKIAGGKEPSANLELVINTVIYKRNLKERVYSTCGSDDPELKERIYQRIKRQRLRTLNRIKTIIGEARLQSDDDALCSFGQSATKQNPLIEGNEASP
jgi:hypothetical protein